MTTNFLASFNKVLAVEGMLGNNYADKGGMTYKVISRIKHPGWPGWIIIDKLYTQASSSSKEVSLPSELLNAASAKKLSEAAAAENKFLNEVASELTAKTENNSILQNPVRVFYHEEFGITVRGDQLPSQAIADESFECAVNLGVQTAAENLQQTINLLNRNARLYSDISVGGIIGSQTLSTLNRCISVNGERLVYNLLNFYQAKHYIEIMESDHAQEVFIGWFNRIEIIKM